MSDQQPRRSRRTPPPGASGGSSTHENEQRREDEASDAALRALRGQLSGVLRRLPAVERRVVELRMGLVDGAPAKPGQVADRLGMTIPEVKQIETRAFARIREVGALKGLERFLER